MRKIWLDMDGTIADLYGVEGWLDMLINHDPTPYATAKPIVNMSALARLLHKAQKNGFEVCIVSALSKNSTPEYDEKVIEAKRGWLKKHLPSVKFDHLAFVPYAFEKNKVNSGDDVLFDDEARHLDAWTGFAVNAKELLTCLRGVPKYSLSE